MSYPESRRLAARAGELIPGGHHLSGRPLLDDAPAYFARARGCRIWDVDGNEYIDYLMAYGAILLGYAHEEVDAAAIAQLRTGSLLSLNHPLHLAFVEALLLRIPGAEMAVFLKTGSEATTAALRIARRATGRRRVARCGYHGWHDWCLPDDPLVRGFDARDPASLQAILDEGDVAAVILAPEMMWPPVRAVFDDLIARTRRAGAVFILDEIKTAFRTPPGTLQEHLGIRPDLTTVSKAMGNGWPIAAIVGPRAIMEHAGGLHLSATYHGDTASMAAALATMAIAERERVAEYVWALGARLIAGLDESARRHDVAARAYGEPLPPMPFLAFTHPDAAHNDRVRTAFFSEVLARGVLLHPRHLWFISQAHRREDIDRTLEICDAVFASLRRST